MTDISMRNASLRQMLIEHRRDMLDDVKGRLRDGRTDRSVEVRDALEHSDADIQGDIELVLLQMRSETLTRIDHALIRLAAGTHGTCAECEREISERRLRALPFAVRCQACEETREQTQEHARRRAQQRTGALLFADMVGS